MPAVVPSLNPPWMLPSSSFPKLQIFCLQPQDADGIFFILMLFLRTFPRELARKDPNRPLLKSRFGLQKRTAGLWALDLES